MNAPSIDHFGRYRILGEIGRGAMGIVYKAEDPALGRVVAVKTILLSPDADERKDHQARFEREARAAAGLNHPAIITIHDMGREGEWLYIAMEMLEGVELRDLMARERLPLERAVDLVGQVARGLAAAHARGVVHRDIKPSNIMILAGDRAKIMDFGIARVAASAVKTQTGLILGSPKYMSPEQAGAREIDHRSDIFSLGGILYELLTGVAPFSGAEVSALMFAIMSDAPAAPSAYNAAVPQMLDLIVAKAMQKEPGMRYQGAAEFAADLDACAAQLRDAAASGAAIFDVTIAEMPVSGGGGTAGRIGDTVTTPLRGVASNGAATGATTLPAHGAGALPSERREAAPLLRLSPSRRFDSAGALGRLRSICGLDSGAPAAHPQGSQLARFLQRPRQLSWFAAYLLAIVCAVLIALY